MSWKVPADVAVAARPFHEDVRDNPTPEFIADLRRRFPVDAESDRLLLRKMNRRADPPHRHLTLNEMSDRLRKMLGEVIDGDFAISGLRWLTGGASKIQISFDLTWTNTREGPSEQRLVIRMDPAEASNTTSREREAELLQLFDGIIAVPKVFWLDADAKWFPEPALIYSFIPGVTRPKNTSAGAVIGLGTNFGPALREVLAPQLLRDLATIHTTDVSQMSFKTMEVPELGSTESARLQLNRARRVWEEDRDEDFPLMDAAACWLEAELPILDQVSVVHGDFRSGNFLFDEQSRQITAWLDWERGLIGDRHRDLAWMTQREKGHFSADGQTYYVCGLIPLDEFYERYEKASGLSVNQRNLKFYRVLNCFQIITTVMGTAYRVAKLAKSHQDILLARIRAVGPVVADELITLLEE
jgi:aminoglycoside phosphotransferase (APT) family kinase protein